MQLAQQASTNHQLEKHIPPSNEGELYLAARTERVRESIIKSYKIIKVPDYFLDQWLPLLRPSRWLAVLSFRQLAFVHKCKQKTGQHSTQTTFRELAKWAGQSRPQMHKLLKSPGLLSWFVDPAEGEFGKHPKRRSERRTYLVRIEIPLTPKDQVKLETFLHSNKPEDDEGWLQLLHNAISAKDTELPSTVPLPDSPKTIQHMVREIRGPSLSLSEDIDWACDELLERWQTQNFGQVTHYFIKKWLPDLTPGLGCLLIWSRRHANKQKDLSQIGRLHNIGLDRFASAVGVTKKTIRRWLADREKYPHTSLFIESIPIYTGAGIVDRISNDGLEVGGKYISLDPETAVKNNIHAGDFISISASRRDGSLLARSLELVSDNESAPFFNQTSTIYDVKLTEPIHPEDHSYYQALLQDQSALGDANFVLHSNIDSVSSDDDKLNPNDGTKVDKQGTLIDISKTKLDKPVSEIDSLETDVDMKDPKVEKQRTEVNATGPEIDLNEPGVDILRFKLRDSKDKSNIIQEQLLQTSAHNSIDETLQNISQSNVVVASYNDWNIAEILTNAAIPKRDREAILSNWPDVWREFVAWLLWSVSTKTIDAPVFHSVSRIKKGEIPPREFSTLASVAPFNLATWLRSIAIDCPEEFSKPIRQLRKNAAYLKLLEIGLLGQGDPQNYDLAEGRQTKVLQHRSDSQVEEDIREPINDGGMTVEEAWRAAKGQLKMDAPRDIYDTWIRDVEIEGFEGGDTFILAVANSYARDWLEDRATSMAQQALTGVIGRQMKVRFVVLEEVG